MYLHPYSISYSSIKIWRNCGVINDISKDIIEGQYLAGFDDKESIVVGQIRQKQKITTKQISINTGIPFRTVQRHIANLRDNNILIRVGSNRDGYWKKILVSKQHQFNWCCLI